MEKNAADVKTLSDAELSAKLGKLQRAEILGFFAGILLIAGGTVFLLITHNVVVFSLILLVGLAFVFLISAPAKRKEKALVQQNLGGFFASELEKAFGAEPASPSMPIDAAFIKSSGLIFPEWERIKTEDLREGVCGGTKFSAANVELRHTDPDSHGPHDTTIRDSEVFKGIILRCENIAPNIKNAAVCDRMEDICGDIGDPSVFGKRFAIFAPNGDDADAATASEMHKLCTAFEKRAGGRLCGLFVQNGNVAVAIKTSYLFAAISPDSDMRDIEGLRRQFVSSLITMGRLTDDLRAATAAVQ